MQTRRDFLKSAAAASAAVAAGISTPKEALAAANKAEAGWKWDKSVCRFCGTGCGVMIATKDDKIVAVKGDPLAPVNRGINCIKGYFLAKIMYGADRLTQPLLRMDSSGKFSKSGKFGPVSWQKAFDVMAEKFKETYNQNGPGSVAIFGSGQYTIQEGYVATKLMKAGFRSNNLDPNARHCMASAVVGFYQTFGVDEPSGCYDDIELTDTIVSWGANMAEMHPVLWARVSERKRNSPDKVKLVNLSTYTNRTSDIADFDIVFKPHTDVAIWNYIAREIVYNNPSAMDQDFIKKHTIFATGFHNIGYGLRPDGSPNYSAKERETTMKEVSKIVSKDEGITLGYLGVKEGDEMKNDGSRNAAHWAISFEDFKKGLEPYTLEYTAALAKGDPNENIESFKKKLKDLASYYIDKKRKVVSFWTMGMNQHTRGTWVNECAYMVHLLLGKQAAPGNGAFSLTGQPSACGTAREVGTFCHRLPSDMLIPNPKHREKTETLWKVPAGTIAPTPGLAYMKIMRAIEDGKVKFAWIQVNNPWHNSANANHWLKAAREMDNFIVCADSYPGISAKVADLILPCAMIYEKWGSYGNAERRTQHWKQSVTPVGEAMSDTWHMLEFAKRFTIKECWGKKMWNGKELPDVIEAAKKMGYKETDTLFDVLFAYPEAKKKYSVKDPVMKDVLNTEAVGDKRKIMGSDGKEWTGYGFFIQKSIFEEYRQFTLGDGHDLADFDTYHRVRGLRWPVVNGKETQWRFNVAYDPYARKVAARGEKFAFYGKLFKEIPSGNLSKPTPDTKVELANKAKIFLRPYMDPPEMPDGEYPLWLCTGRVLEHWHSGTMTMQVPELANAVPSALCYMHENDAKKLGVQQNDTVKIESRRGNVNVKVDLRGRNRVPEGLIYVPWFDEKVFINKVCLDATCPISEETDFKKCAVKVSKA
ncbi:MAG: nitrate reductase catalytic subunit NapA [Helicobacteraceae bacterium]|jgi:nitrate reductase NapA|nr:nitrate reductase catalytic subunit NapA [Helicobacteraceae bacterium]